MFLATSSPLSTLAQHLDLSLQCPSLSHLHLLIHSDIPGAFGGAISGEVNGIRLPPQELRGNMTPTSDSNQIYVRLDRLPGFTPTSRAMIGQAIAPCWLYANGVGADGRPQPSLNGFRLSDGRYRQESHIRFDSGEQLFVQQVGRGQQADGGFVLVETLLRGDVPAFPGQRIVSVKPYSDYYAPTGPGQMSGRGRSVLHVGPYYAVPFTWQNNVTYDEVPSRAIRARPMEIRVDGIDVTSDNAFVSSGHGFRLRADARPLPRCPSGYRPSPVGQNLCLDVDECREGLAGCKDTQECENEIGAYRCLGACKEGYRLLPNGTCSDVDECSLGLMKCEAGEECRNSQGGSACVPACPRGFRRDSSGGCRDRDECREEIPCGPGKLCLNTHGSFRCLCPPGFHETVSGGPCIGQFCSRLRSNELHFLVLKHPTEV